MINPTQFYNFEYEAGEKFQVNINYLWGKMPENIKDYTFKIYSK